MCSLTHFLTSDLKTSALVSTLNSSGRQFQTECDEWRHEYSLFVPRLANYRTFVFADGGEIIRLKFRIHQIIISGLRFLKMYQTPSAEIKQKQDHQIIHIYFL